MIKKRRNGLLQAGFISVLLVSCASVAMAGDYNKIAAASYARQYANFPNLGFRYFPENDCTNFVSQALDAGQEQKTGGWYYKYFNNFSSSWTVAHDLFNFLRNAGRADFIGEGVGSNWGGYNALEPGDLIFASWNDNGWLDHIYIVTGRDSRGILVSAHTTPHCNMPFTDALNQARYKRWRFYYLRMRSHY